MPNDDVVSYAETLRPILDRIVIKRIRDVRPETSLLQLAEDVPSDVFEAASAPETVILGVVLRVGPGRRRRGGGRILMPVRQGDEVLFYSHVGVPIGGRLLVMKPEDLLACKRAFMPLDAFMPAEDEECSA